MIASYLLSTKAMTAKIFVLASPVLALQEVSSAGTLERLMNISIAIFVMAVGLYVLWKQFQKESEYVKDQSGELRDIVERVSSIAESSSRSVQNSTEAMRDISKSLNKFSDRIENLEDRLKDAESRAGEKDN